MKHPVNIWREALSEFPDSGLSLRKFCRERHLNYARALYWRRRLAPSASSKDSTLTFSLVQLPNTEQPSDSGIAVECGKHLIRLSSRFDESVLLRVVTLLSGQES